MAGVRLNPSSARRCCTNCLEERTSLCEQWWANCFKRGCVQLSTSQHRQRLHWQYLFIYWIFSISLEPVWKLTCMFAYIILILVINYCSANVIVDCYWYFRILHGQLFLISSWTVCTSGVHIMMVYFLVSLTGGTIFMMLILWNVWHDNRRDGCYQITSCPQKCFDGSRTISVGWVLKGFQGLDMWLNLIPF